jgi:hypothetical protein
MPNSKELMHSPRITCNYCDWTSFNQSKYVGNVLAAHLNRCTAYKEATQSSKRRALLNREAFPAPPLAHSGQHFEFNDEYEDHHEEFDQEIIASDEQIFASDEDEKYYQLFGHIKHDMLPSSDVYMFQQQLASLTGTDSEVAPFQTGWIRPSEQGTARASWEDYVLLNQHVVQWNLSTACGDDMLKVFRQLCDRENIVLAIPRSMRTVK